MAESPISFEVKLDRGQIERLTGTEDMHKAMTQMAGYVETRSKFYSPVRTGNLRRSIYSEVVQEGAWIARVGTNVKYGLFQELGTVRHPPHPFLRPALADLQASLRFGTFRG